MHFLKSFAITIVNKILAQLAAGLFQIFLASIFLPDVFGTFVLSLAVFSVFSTIGMTGLGKGITHQTVRLTAAERPAPLRGLVWQSLGVVLLTSTALATVLIVYADEIGRGIFDAEDMTMLLTYFGVVLVPYSLAQVFASVLRGLEHYGEGLVVGETIWRLGTAVFFLALIAVYGPSIEIAASAYLISALTMFVTGLLLCHRAINLTGRADLVREPLVAMLRFSAPLYLVGVLDVLRDRIIHFILGVSLDLSAVAIFQVALSMTSLLNGLIQSMSWIIQPLTAKRLHAGGKRVVDLMNVACRLSRFLGVPAVLFIGAFSEQIVALIWGPAYASSAPLMTMLSLVALVELYTGPQAAMLTGYGVTGLLARYTISSMVITILAAFLVIPHWGTVGAVASFALGRLMLHAILAVALCRYIGIAYLSQSRDVAYFSCCLALTILARGAAANVEAAASVGAGIGLAAAALSLTAGLALYRRDASLILAGLRRWRAEAHPQR